MTSTSTQSHSPRWPLIILAIVGLIIAAPFLFALLGLGLALTIGLAALAVKIGVVVLAIWAVVMVFKAIFGGPSHKAPLPPSRDMVSTTATHYDPEAESEREKREHLAKLDRELELAIAKKNAGQES